MAMIMFRVGQRIKIVKNGDSRLIGRKGTVKTVSQMDESAVVQMEGSSPPARVELWPDDCSPVGEEYADEPDTAPQANAAPQAPIDMPNDIPETEDEPTDVDADDDDAQPA